MTRSESWKKKFVKFRRQKELQFFALAGVAYLIIFSIIPIVWNHSCFQIL